MQDDTHLTYDFPVGPLLSTNGPLNTNQDNAWIDLTKVPGWDADHWTIIIETMMPDYVNPPSATAAGARTILEVDDGMGLDGFYLVNQQDPISDTLCNGVLPYLFHCPDWALIPNQSGVGAAAGKVRATYSPTLNGLEWLAPPGPGQFSAVGISYNRDNGVDAITVDTGGRGQTLSNGNYIPPGVMPVLTSLVTPPYPAGIFRRLVLGGAPNELMVIGGTPTVGDVVALNASWENPQTSAQTASPSYTVLSTDTPTTIAAALAAAITSNGTLAASSISATSIGASIYPSHPPGLFVFWTRTITGAATETVALGANSANYYGYIQRLRIFSRGMQNADFTAAMPGITPSRVQPTFWTWNTNGHIMLNGGKLLCNRC